MPKQTKRRMGRRSNRNTGPSTAPKTTLRRTFRYTETFQLNNSAGSGLNQYAYTSRVCKFEPSKATGFREAQSTFELWKMTRGRAKVMPAYNNYNQTYNTVNLDATASVQVWTAADWGLNETLSGVSIMSYNNARCSTLSLNEIKTVVNTTTRLNLGGESPLAIMPTSAWLDTSTDQGTNRYNGFQLFARMPGMNANNYLPEIQVIFEVDCEFKQPAFQNRPTTFEQEIIGSTLEVQPAENDPATRMYNVTEVKQTANGLEYRLLRSDGEPGSLTYTGEEMYSVWTFANSGPYFSGRGASWTGPQPRRPLGYTPVVSQLEEEE